MTRTILSVCDFELKASRAYSLNGTDAFHATFVLPANKIGEHSTIQVHNMFDRFHAGDNNYAPTPETATNIANDLVGEWTKGTVVPPMGVLVCAGDEETPEEIERAMGLHRVRCEYLRNRAAELWATDKRTQATDPQYRRASLYLGYTDDPWLMAAKPVSDKKCPWCQQSVPTNAAICSHCGQKADFELYAQLEAKQQAAMERASKPTPQIPMPIKVQARS